MFDKKSPRAGYLVKNGVYYAAVFYLGFVLGKFAVEFAEEEGLL